MVMVKMETLRPTLFQWRSSADGTPAILPMFYGLIIGHRNAMEIFEIVDSLPPLSFYVGFEAFVRSALVRSHSVTISRSPFFKALFFSCPPQRRILIGLGDFYHLFASWRGLICLNAAFIAILATTTMTPGIMGIELG